MNQRAPLNAANENRTPEDVAALRKLKEWFVAMGDTDETLAAWIADAKVEPRTAFRRDIDRFMHAISMAAP